MNNLKNARWENLRTQINMDLQPGCYEEKKFLELCKKFENIFYVKGDRLSYTQGITHRIPTNPSTAPINQKNYRLPQVQKEIINQAIQELFRNNIVEHSNSPWNSPLLVVDKKPGPDGKKRYRVVIDYRKLNNQTIGDAYPLPRIDDILDQLNKSKIFSTLDLASGYHQVPIAESDKEKTAFSTPLGHLHFLRMPFGLKGAPATFQRLMDNTLAGLLGSDCFVYLDDIVVYSQNIQEHLQKLNRIFERISNAKLKLQPEKCNFFKKEIIYLGHKCTAKGCEPDPEKTSAIQNIQKPENIKQVQSFLGIANYYRRFIPNFSKTSLPLVKLTRKQVRFNWNQECEEAFNKLKQTLISNNVLAYPDFDKPFEISTDASNEALGAVLSQESKPISFASKTLSSTETRYSTIEKELLGVVWGVKKFRCYVYGQHFTVFTDHKPLLGIHKMKDPSSRLLRLYLKLAEYSITLEYRPGKHNTIADGLSRLPLNINVITRAQAKKYQNSENRQSQIKFTDPELEWQEIINFQNAEEENMENFKEQENDIDIFYNRTERENIRDTKTRKAILKLYHDHKLGGHQGSTKTYQRIKRQYRWPNMKKDIENYVKSCQVCQLNKSGKSTKMAMVLSMPANYPFEKIYLDVVGPLPVTEKGNKYILSIMDDLSRYMNCYPIPDQEADTISETFVTQVLGHHKTPKIVLTDQGRNFLSEIFKKTCNLFGIKKIQTTAYHPQTNGALERHHKTLADYLRTFSRSNPDKWDTLLPYAMYVHNNSPNASTRIAPNDCLFGYISRMPTKIRKNPGMQYNFDCNYNNMYHEIHKVWQWVQDNQEEYKKLTKIYYDKKIYEQTFLPGNKVYVRNEARKHKLAPLWTGPHEIVETKGKVTSIVRIGKNVKAVHNNRLRLHYPKNNAN